jgi:hypothetical protein
MRGVWVDAGNDPVYERLDAQGIRWVYFPLSDPVADVRRRLLDVKQRGYAGGVYAAWNWYGDPSGPLFAETVHRALQHVAPDATNTWPKVMLDDERHDPATIQAELVRWRQLRPYNDTAWTFESGQAGWFSPSFVVALTTARVRLVPQCYRGDMVAVDTLAEARALIRQGVPDAAISPFYDAGKLPLDWQGFAFTMGRLPKVG